LRIENGEGWVGCRLHPYLVVVVYNGVVGGGGAVGGSKKKKIEHYLKKVKEE
jgi:hypothetical protein